MGFSSWLYANSTKNLRVKIVHPGGHVELHERPVLAAEIIRRNPKCCVAHPNVFKQPWAIVQPDTILMPGQKVYIVPINTVRKLQSLSLKNSPSLMSQSLKPEEGDQEDGTVSLSPCSLVVDTTAKTKDGSSSNLHCFACSIGSSEKKKLNRKRDKEMDTKEESPKKPASLDYWQPSLKSISEE